MRVLYPQTASDDIVRQFRYYLLAADAPEIRMQASYDIAQTRNREKQIHVKRVNQLVHAEGEPFRGRDVDTRS
ncbi:MAG TPA: hypothetical protein VEW05_14430 [Candidatus Polarisedimenticolia bacterium]|nr:hypothetical protein [Candidatus Polarisedimenticolia bacterium]